MTSSPSTREIPFSAVRIFKRTGAAYKTVLRNLYAAIGTEAGNKLFELTPKRCPNEEIYRSAINKRIGPYGFMLMKEFNHGWWMNLINEDNQQYPGSTRVILGNPFIAITMLKHDLRGGLFVPVELLIRDVSDDSSEGGKEVEATEVSYLLPSSLIAPQELEPTEEVRKAAKILDDKLARLVEDICTGPVLKAKL